MKHKTRPDEPMKTTGNGHRIRDTRHCLCNRETEERCPTCDWGLSVCFDCNRAEAELDQPCDDGGRLRRLSRAIVELDLMFHNTDREWGELPRMNLDTFNRWCELLRVAERVIEEERAKP